MSKVIFSVSYVVKEEYRDDYFIIAKELKNLIKADGLLYYDIYEEKMRNHFREFYEFANEEAFENYDDSNELVAILNEKLSQLIEEKTLAYKTYKPIFE